MGIQEILSETGETTLDLPAQPVGALRFACGMGMYSGSINFEEASAFANATTPTQQQPIAGTPVTTSPANPSAPSVQTTDCDPNITSCLSPGIPQKQAGLVVSNNFLGPISPAQATTQAGIQAINVQVTDYGYQPAVTRAKANVRSKLVLQTDGTYG